MIHLSVVINFKPREESRGKYQCSSDLFSEWFRFIAHTYVKI